MDTATPNIATQTFCTMLAGLTGNSLRLISPEWVSTTASEMFQKTFNLASQWMPTLPFHMGNSTEVATNNNTTDIPPADTQTAEQPIDTNFLNQITEYINGAYTGVFALASEHPTECHAVGTMLTWSGIDWACKKITHLKAGSNGLSIPLTIGLYSMLSNLPLDEVALIAATGVLCYLTVDTFVKGGRVLKAHYLSKGVEIKTSDLTQRITTNNTK